MRNLFNSIMFFLGYMPVKEVKEMNQEQDLITDKVISNLNIKIQEQTDRLISLKQAASYNMYKEFEEKAITLDEITSLITLVGIFNKNVYPEFKKTQAMYKQLLQANKELYSPEEIASAEDLITRVNTIKALVEPIEIELKKIIS